jgi:tetratricopeptide (TPR) repeat protein
MKNHLLPTAIFGIAALVTSVSPAFALSPVEIQRIAKQTTVQIIGCSFGSGVIIRKNGNTYTVLTVAHAVKNSGCEVTTPDNAKYSLSQIKTFPNSVDLAVFTFTSNSNYSVAKLIDNSDRIEAMETVYVSGFPKSTAINKSTFTIVKGDVIANPSNTQQGKGYSLIYSNNTLPGHSGGPVWNDRGELIAIHGQGDIDSKLQATIDDEVRVKTGYNLGITINTFNKLAATAGVSGYPATIATTSPSSNPFSSIVTTSTPKPVANPVPSTTTTSASEPFSWPFGSSTPKPKPLDDLIASAIKKERDRDYQGMLADANSAIALDPKNSRAYVIRGRARENSGGDYKINYKEAYKDYTQAIALDPNNTQAYFYRAGITFYNDRQKLADYDRAIAIDPNYADLYWERSQLKSKLKDFKGEVEDLDRYITLEPTATAVVYRYRGEAKLKLGNFTKAIEDFNRVIAMQPRHVQAYYYRGMSKFKLGDKQGALTDFNQAIEFQYDPAYIERATVRSQLGDKSGAIEDLKIVANVYKKGVVTWKKYVDEDPTSSGAKNQLRWYNDRYQKVMKEIKRLGG